MRGGRLLVLSFVMAPLAIAAACSSFGDETPSPGQPDATTEAAPNDSAGGDTADVGLDVTDASADVRTYRYVFASAGTHNGKFGLDPDSGLFEADKFCTNEALSAPKLAGIKWRAWLATSTASARDRIADAGTIPQEYRLVDDTTVVFRATYSYPASGPVTPVSLITLDQNGVDAGTSEVWTGTGQDGLVYSGGSHCTFWSSLADEGFTGWTTNPTFGPTNKDEWTSAISGPTRTCSTLHRLYCFEVAP